MQHKTDVAVSFFPRQRMINNFFQTFFWCCKRWFSMSQTFSFYVADVIFWCCKKSICCIQHLRMLRQKFSLLDYRPMLDVQTLAVRLWNQTDSTWPCPGHILLHPGHVLATYFSFLIDILHRSSHSSMGLFTYPFWSTTLRVCLVRGLIFFEEIHRLILAWLECGTWPVQTYPILAINPYLVFFC